MSDEAQETGTPSGFVPLALAVDALRAELVQLWTQSQGSALRFAVEPVELTLQVAVTTSGKASAGIRWWLVEAGAEASREAVSTQTVRLTLTPRLVGADGRPGELLVAGDEPDPGGAAQDEQLDAPA